MFTTTADTRQRLILYITSALLLVIIIQQGMARAADGDEKVIFLHHSTGGAVYGEGDVVSWFDTYNAVNGTQYEIGERSYPNSPYPWDNYPYDYWNLWVNGACDDAQSGIACMTSLARDYDVVIFKHCYPGADVLEDEGNPAIDSSRKSLENYKLQYRALRTLMDGYADTQFIVWTLAPRHRLATSTGAATRARAFVDWVRDEWLTEDGHAHPNIAIFDFWGYAAEENTATTPGQGPVNTLKYDYESSHSGSDSHPNTLANETIGPLFAQFIVDTIEDTATPEGNVIRVPQDYATIAAAAAAAQDGDTVEIAAGTYSNSDMVATWGQNDLTIRGVGGRVHLDAEGVTIANDKAIWVTGGDNITIEQIDFSHAEVDDENGAGIRSEGDQLTLRHCSFSNNQTGILTSNKGTEEILIEYCEFNHNGLGDPGYTHNIYVGRAAKFTLRGSYSHHALHGHNVKSRAAENHILYNRIMDEDDGQSSYLIDLPNGGLSFLIGNVFHQGTQAENVHMVSYAAEGADNPIQALYVSANTLVNERNSGDAFRLVGTPTAHFVNNLFVGVDDNVLGDTSVFTGNVSTNEPDFSDAEHFDFRPTAASTVVDAGEAPGSAQGVDLNPTHEYQHPMSLKPRASDAHLDVGAFELATADDADDGDGDGDAGDDDNRGGDGDGDGGGTSSKGCFLETLLL
jgi:hypothetical protein